MTRIHKRIGRRIRKFAGHYTKYLLRRDTILATLSVFIFLILLGMIPINFYVLNPMKMALKDFDFNDLAYAKLKKGELKEGKNSKFDSRIVIVNIGHADREELAYIIEKVSSLNPKVIGLDAYFIDEKDPYKDSIFSSTVSKIQNLISASRLAVRNDSFVTIKEYFDSSFKKRGSVTLPGEDVGTVRYFAPFEIVEGKKFPHFSTALVEAYDHDAFLKLEKRHKEVEMINYTRRSEQYQIIEKDDLLTDGVDEQVLNGKIVMLGYVNLDPYDIEDKKFTPMNARFAGKKFPDMNGVIVLANIASMILDANYIKKMPSWVAWLVAIFIGWVHMSLFIRYYLEDHIWFHLVAKLAQVFSVLFFAYLGIYIFDEFRIKLDMKYTLYVIVLAVDVIYFYEALVVWLNKKFGFHTVFQQHHHGHH